MRNGRDAHETQQPYLMRNILIKIETGSTANIKDLIDVF